MNFAQATRIVFDDGRKIVQFKKKKIGRQIQKITKIDLAGRVLVQFQIFLAEQMRLEQGFD